MKIRGKTAGVAILSLLWAAAGAVAAAPVDPGIQPILDANGCSNCHAQSEQIVGPSFDAVRQKYHGRHDALDVLVPKVRGGGSGVWGQVAMPPNPNISDSDLHKVLKVILNGGPSGARPAKPRS